MQSGAIESHCVGMFIAWESGEHKVISCAGAGEELHHRYQKQWILTVYAIHANYVLYSDYSFYAEKVSLVSRVFST